MKIFIATNYFLPGVKGGGPIKSLDNLITHLSNDFEFYVYTKSKDVGEKENYVDIQINKWISNSKYKVKYVEKITLKTLKDSIKDIQPDIIYLNSLFATSSIYTYILSNFLKTKIILSPRGELNNNALKLKSRKKNIVIKIIKLLKIFDDIIFHATSESEKKDILSIFPNNEVRVIQNLSSKYPNIVRNKIKNKNHLDLVTIARINKMKNIHYFLEVLSHINVGQINYDIYGPKEDEEYYKICKKIIGNFSDNIKVNFKGTIENDSIHQILKNYDFFISSTLGENFGHTIVEALQNHIPVIISNNTPWKKLEYNNVGYDIDLDKKIEFINVIKEVLTIDNTEYYNTFFGFEDFLRGNLKMEDTIKDYKKLFLEAEKLE